MPTSEEYGFSPIAKMPKRVHNRKRAKRDPRRMGKKN